MVYILAREILFWYQLDKLTNKLMSRNFYDYRVTEQMKNEKPAPEKPEPPEEPEDLGGLAGFG